MGVLVLKVSPYDMAQAKKGKKKKMYGMMSYGVSMSGK